MSEHAGDATASAFADIVDRAVLSLSRHWLAALLTYATLLTALPIAAPMLKAAGHTNLSAPIYFMYQFICHQQAERSLHVRGEQMAFCARDLAIFAGTTGVAAAYGFLRRSGAPGSTRHWIVLLTIVPIGVDVLTQLIGLRESTTALRIGTGLIFSCGIGWYVLPRLDSGFRGLERDIRDRSVAGPKPASSGSKFRKA